MESSLDIAFWVCAIAATAAFFLQLVLFGIAGTEIGGAEFDVQGGDVLQASDFAFQVLSFKSLTGFFLGFGWGGLAFHQQFQFGAGLSFFLAIACGLTMLFFISAIFRLAFSLQSPGAQFSVADAVGRRASVYSRIPESGKGQIQIGLAGQTRFIDAVAEENQNIESFATVEVLRVVDSNTVLVRRIGSGLN